MFRRFRYGLFTVIFTLWSLQQTALPQAALLPRLAMLMERLGPVLIKGESPTLVGVVERAGLLGKTATVAQQKQLAWQMSEAFLSDPMVRSETLRLSREQGLEPLSNGLFSEKALTSMIQEYDMQRPVWSLQPPIAPHLYNPAPECGSVFATPCNPTSTNSLTPLGSAPPPASRFAVAPLPNGEPLGGIATPPAFDTNSPLDLRALELTKPHAPPTAFDFSKLEMPTTPANPEPSLPRVVRVPSMPPDYSGLLTPDAPATPHFRWATMSDGTTKLVDSWQCGLTSVHCL